MISFLTRVALFALVLAAAYGALAHGVRSRTPPDDGTARQFVQTLRAKHMRAEGLDQPALLFAGGSNLPYGIHSDVIEQGLQVPVANLGMNAGLGLDWILNEVRHFAQPGDAVVLSLEYFIGDGDYKLTRHIVRRYPRTAGFFAVDPIEEVRLHLRTTRERLDRVLEARRAGDRPLTIPPDDALSTASYKPSEPFNHWGDRVLDPAAPSRFRLLAMAAYAPPTRHWSGIRKINRLARYARQHDIQLALMYPSFPAPIYAHWRDALDAYHQANQDRLTIPILNAPQDFLYPVEAFYDSEYHLMPQARVDYTAAVIRMLRDDPHLGPRIARIAALYRDAPEP